MHKNKIFSNLKAIKHLGNGKWLFECLLCGRKDFEAAFTNVRRGKYKSCGCHKLKSRKIFEKYKKEIINDYRNRKTITFIKEKYGITKYSIKKLLKEELGEEIKTNIPEDLAGFKNNRLTVIEEDGRINRNVRWKCLCDCGKITYLTKSEIKKGLVKSCGCLRDEIAAKNGVERGLKKTQEIDFEVSSIKRIFRNYKTSATKRKLKFDICFNLFSSLLKQKCFYCGREPYTKVTNNNKLIIKEFLYNGIDRKDSEIGYENGNIITCCQECNYAKRKMSIEQFFSLIKMIKDNHSL